MSDSIFTIELKDLEFFSFHGVHEEEKMLGGRYIVSLKVLCRATETIEVHIDHTINYVNLYEIVKKEMQEPRELLETIAGSVIEKIKNKFSKAISAEIKIEKLHPPINNFIGSVSVSLSRQF